MLTFGHKPQGYHMTHDVTEIPDSDPTTAVGLAIAGIIPIVAALLILIVHLANPLPDHHRGLVYCALVVLPMASLALWLWCTARRIERHFDRKAADAEETARRIEARIDDLTMTLDLLQRSTQGVHRRLDAIEQEAEHLRGLVVEDAIATPGQRLGPRSLS